MRRGVGIRALVVLVASCLAVLAAFPARAGSPPARGRIVLTLLDGSRGPLDLAPSWRELGASGGWVGEILVANQGNEPLTVSRVAIRGDQDDIRSPPRVSVRFKDGAPTTATLAPGASKTLFVSFTPENPRITQAFGHVIVTSTDEQAGEVAMGFRAQLPTGLGWVGEHALSLLVLWPLAVVLLAGALRAAGRRDDRMVRRGAIAVSATELLLAFWTYRRFVPGLGRADGNDGFQLVERSVWLRTLGVEWYLGVDGTSVVLVLLASLVALVAVLAAGNLRSDTGRSDEAHAALALLTSGIVGVLVALDAVVLVGAWATAIVAAVILLGGWGENHGKRAAAKVGVVGAISVVALLVAVAALSGASGRTFLVDGTPMTHSMAIPEFARTSFSSSAPVLGVPLVAAAWVLLFLAAAIASPAVPLHGWLADALEEGPAAAAIVVGGAMVTLGPYLLIRVGLGALPEGAHWAGPSMAAIGGLGAAWGALGAMAQRDLRRFVAYTIVENAGLALYAIGSLTTQGIAGAVLALWAHGLAAAMLLAVAHALSRRVGTCDVTRVQGLAGEAPMLAAMLAVGLGVSLGVPGLVGAWAVVLSIVGGATPHPFVALWMAGAIVVSAAAHARVGRVLLFEPVDPAWRRSRQLEPYAGKLPDATSLEMAALVPLAALALGLGLWPAPLLTPMEAAARDASAAVEPTP
ncbi:MAG TPA: proton-conducting transporter membrane subunit [Polyangiaceae bacterium]|nr:proton-conducting transporter membrane subunit [Polyangiaceae bacterium]